MRLFFLYAYKICIFIKSKYFDLFNQANTGIKFYVYGIRVAGKSIVRGRVDISMPRTASFSIGHGLRINSGRQHNPIGREDNMLFFVGPGAVLTIGDNVGMSSAAIVCRKEISIGSNVLIGGGVCIYDTDFHSIDYVSRNNPAQDKLTTVMRPVSIGDNVFIGAHATILKGVSIGQGAVIGACSVVTKSVPAHEIWAGNPAKFVRKINSRVEST